MKFQVRFIRFPIVFSTQNTLEIDLKFPQKWIWKRMPPISQGASRCQERRVGKRRVQGNTHHVSFCVFQIFQKTHVFLQTSCEARVFFVAFLKKRKSCFSGLQFFSKSIVFEITFQKQYIFQKSQKPFKTTVTAKKLNLMFQHFEIRGYLNRFLNASESGTDFVTLQTIFSY